MVYLISSLKVMPQKMQEFTDMFEKEFLPLMDKHGMKLVGCWQTAIGDLDECTFIWAVDSLEQYEKNKKSRMQDPEFLEKHPRIVALRQSETVKIATPLPCSPLK